MGHIPQESVGGMLICLSRLWARRWINHWSLWRMASATPDLRLPSQPQGITAAWPVPNYTAWWQRHVCEQLAQGCYLNVERPGFEPATFCVMSQHPSHYTTSPHYYSVEKTSEEFFICTWHMTCCVYDISIRKCEILSQLWPGICALYNLCEVFSGFCWWLLVCC